MTMESRANGAAVRVVLAYVILRPLFALLGAGVSVIVVPLASAIAGTWMYGTLRRRPH